MTSHFRHDFERQSGVQKKRVAHFRWPPRVPHDVDNIGRLLERRVYRTGRWLIVHSLASEACVEKRRVAHFRWPPRVPHDVDNIGRLLEHRVYRTGRWLSVHSLASDACVEKVRRAFSLATQGPL